MEGDMVVKEKERPRRRRFAVVGGDVTELKRVKSFTCYSKLHCNHHHARCGPPNYQEIQLRREPKEMISTSQGKLDSFDSI